MLKTNINRRRRLVFIAFFLIFLAISSISVTQESTEVLGDKATINFDPTDEDLALNVLNRLDVKDDSSTIEYNRDVFGSGWATKNGCDTRNIILFRDLSDSLVDEKCNVTKGTLQDPYTGMRIDFVRGSSTSSKVQIDHVVALSDAWRKGAQHFSKEKRVTLANDPLELLAVDGKANQEKSGNDAASWLPPNKLFRCQYVARQIAVKAKYQLWVSHNEYGAIKNVLSGCVYQTLPK